MLNIINGILVLPNRILVKLDSNNDYFKTFHHPLGLVRITVEKAWGFADEPESATRKLFSKMTRAHPDCYAEVEVGAEEAWRTSTKNNTTSPAWNETHDFVVTDFDQCIKVELQDHDVGSDDLVGLGITTVRDLITAGGKQELSLVKKGEETDGKISLACEFFDFAATADSFSSSSHKGDGKLCGLVSILVAGAFGIKGQREVLQPSVVVTWGSKHRFQTAIKKDAPGLDINNPVFDQHFRILVTADMASSGESLRISCFDKDNEVGGVDVPFDDILKAPNMTLEDNFDVGNGATVRASICLRGVTAGNTGDIELTHR